MHLECFSISDDTFKLHEMMYMFHAKHEWWPSKYNVNYFSDFRGLL